ncbi:MAG: tetratricopeptide repeat protein [Nitrospirae bacterium]|nr:tetratricopeptide repeat protein [Nitrospirota bacterium]
MLSRIFLVLLILLAVQGTAIGGSIEKADMLRKHALLTEAKIELIDIIFSNATEAVKATAYYDLGTIAFEEKNISGALDTWTQLVGKYPKSQQATLVRDRIKELSEIVGEVSKASAENAIAQSYLSHADFWSERKSSIFRIDSSWIPNVEAAVKWYDKVIAEFPKSVASRLAYEGKMRTYLGWEVPGKYGGYYGIQGNFNKYMPELLDTLSAFESDHPEAPTLQAFRFQIAQAYWRQKDWDKTKEWLNLIIQKTGTTDSFYKDLAERRLQQVEY